MSMKPVFLVLGLLLGTACLAATESSDSSTPDSPRTQSSTADQGSDTTTGAATATSRDRNQDSRQPPNMADYCKEHTC